MPNMFDQTIRRPLVSVAVACVLADADAIKVRQACEDGKIEWSFNVGTGDQGDRREIRIWRGSLLKWMGASVPSVTADDVLSDILLNRDLRSSELWRRLAISRRHLCRMLPELKVVQEAKAERGINAACKISNASARKMLLNRRLA
jgi:hypothetical protein